MIERMKKVIAAAAPDLNTDNVTEATDLYKDLGMNSLSMMLVALGIEDEFNIRFEDNVDFHTVGDVCAYLRSHGVKE